MRKATSVQHFIHQAEDLQYQIRLWRKECTKTICFQSYPKLDLGQMIEGAQVTRVRAWRALICIGRYPDGYKTFPEMTDFYHHAPPAIQKQLDQIKVTNKQVETLEEHKRAYLREREIEVQLGLRTPSMQRVNTIAQLDDPEHILDYNIRRDIFPNPGIGEGKEIEELFHYFLTNCACSRSGIAKMKKYALYETCTREMNFIRDCTLAKRAARLPRYSGDKFRIEDLLQRICQMCPRPKTEQELQQLEEYKKYLMSHDWT